LLARGDVLVAVVDVIVVADDDDLKLTFRDVRDGVLIVYDVVVVNIVVVVDIVVFALETELV